MHAAVLHGVADLRYEEFETPQAGPGEVIIKVRATGICGSDIPRVLGHAAHYYPIVLGHEFSGVIHELGEGVENLHIGQRATAAPLVPCLQCGDCQQGQYALCRQYRFIGSSLPGSFAEYVKAPARNVVPFDDQVSFVQGAFFEPSTVALHGLRRAGYHGGEQVAILGGGTIGLFTLQWAKQLGARSVTVFDINNERLALASALGADATVNTTQENWPDLVQSVVGEKGYGYVFETAGQNATMNMAFDLAANRAQVCFIGTASKDLAFGWKQFEKMNRKEFDLTGSWMSYSAPFPGAEWSMTADYFSQGKIKFDDRLVFRTFDLSEAQTAFDLYRTPGAVNGKIMLTMDN